MRKGRARAIEAVLFIPRSWGTRYLEVRRYFPIVDVIEVGLIRIEAMGIGRS